MPCPLRVLAAAVAAPLLGLVVHTAAPAHAVGVPSAHATSVLPNNLCASCHGGGRVVSSGSMALATRDLVAARTYLQAPPQG